MTKRNFYVSKIATKPISLSTFGKEEQLVWKAIVGSNNNVQAVLTFDPVRQIGREWCKSSFSINH